MGITGLIPFLEKASSKVQLRDFRGTTMCVDTYCWLHKGVFCCAEKLVRGEDTDKYLQYCLRYVQMLLSNDIKPILVFDGRHLPAKALTEQRRRESRLTSKRLAAELLRAGRTEEARSHMRRCVDVTHEMALRLIRECRMRNVDCIVAPYEADAQLAWLNKMDLAQYIITEDSDLVLFGARKIIFKLDLTGAGLLVESHKLHLAMGCHPDKYTFEKFLRMCILSGCDYLDSLPGIGLAKACKFMLKTEEVDMRRALRKIPAYLNMRQLEVDDNYIDSFLRAEATFRHMYIYNPLLRRMERLNPLEVYQTAECWCTNAGTLIENEKQALQLALGNLNPFTLKQLDDWHPDDNADRVNSMKLPKGVSRAKHKSIWSYNYAVPQKSTPKEAKLDFISQALNEEINAKLTEENAKPAELDIFNMYRFTSKQQIVKLPAGIDVHDHKAKTYSTPVKNYYNPFVKTAEMSPPVCENTSLLKVLTPLKSKKLESDVAISSASPKPSPRKPGIKRSLFAQQVTAPMPTVKSRFFSNNVKPSVTIAACSDVSAKIEQIKQNTREQQELQALFYKEIASPRKKIARLQAPIETDEKDNSTRENVVKQKTDDENCIIMLLSDDDTNLNDEEEKKLAYHKPAALRLGLSKNRLPGTKKKLTPTKATQSLLSKFGFQRKPVLK